MTRPSGAREANDTICSGEGFDTLIGGAGNDTLDGQGGADAADYSPALAGVDVNLQTGHATGEGSDTLYSVSQVYGSDSNDTLRGSDTCGAEYLGGRGGSDELSGGAGDDTLVGGAGRDALNGEAGADTLTARDGEVDAVDCGDDPDPTATIDRDDTSRAGCELVDDGPDPPPVDRTAPQATIDSGPSGTVASNSARFAFRASEPGRFECSLDASAFGACSSPTLYESLSKGGHSFSVRAVDRAGNADLTPATRGWVVRLPVLVDPFSCSFRPSATRLAKGLKRGVLASFTCTQSARVTMRLTLPRSTARRMGLTKSRSDGAVTVAKARPTSGKSGKLRLRFSSKTRRVLARQRRVRLTLRSSAQSRQSSELASAQRKLVLRR